MGSYLYIKEASYKVYLEPHNNSRIQTKQETSKYNLPLANNLETFNEAELLLPNKMEKD